MNQPKFNKITEVYIDYKIMAYLSIFQATVAITAGFSRLVYTRLYG